MAKNLKGVLAPVATPFKNDELDLDGFQKNIKMLNDTGLAGYLVLGSNGEAVYLNESEKKQVIEAARSITPEDKILMIGAGAEATRAVMELSEFAANAGCDCVMVLPPHYYKGQMDGLRLKAHYNKIADESSIPVLIYNMPANTGINLDAGLVANLSAHPNIVGVKDSSGNMTQLSEILREAEEDFSVFVGSSPLLYPALCLGSSGGILAVANVMPNICCKIQASFEQGDLEQAHKLHQALTPLAIMVTSRWGVPGLKACMNMMGFNGGEVRSPLTDITDAEILDALKNQIEILSPYEK